MFPIPTKWGRCTDSSYSVVFLPNRRLRLRSEHAHASVHAQATIQFGLQMVHESFWLRPTCLTPLPRESRGPLRNRLLDKRDALKVLKHKTNKRSRRMIIEVRHQLTVTLHPETVHHTTRTLLSWHGVQQLLESRV